MLVALTTVVDHSFVLGEFLLELLDELVDEV